ncbi:acid phosphatase [Stenotrophomonas mori]|uniref:Acid phosphatase n=1 Tax=Stenotrophomonas mori TaxID=2871096 RepID=A0ABT0SHC3_9GAMM|nr:phosphatase PAP2 family protein [Stenotrophomonas mori]MCL7714736.1 phosphatase PAP2 family protein [Stenotrophomonas mori]
MTLLRSPLVPLLATGLCLLASACATPAATARDAVPEIRPGVARGYLETAQLPDSIALLPPPPAPGSAAFALDEQVNQARALRGSPRWQQAIADANLQFPEAASIFACAIGSRIDEATTPRLYGLLRRTRTDAAVVSDAAKDRYNRTRPFVANGEATCTPDKEAGLAQNGSYPSGHTSIGWAWALILAELAPDRSDAILARGRSYGESRLVCNVHWHSDVLSGRFMGSAVVARLHGDPRFRQDMDAARSELAAARQATGSTPPAGCDAAAAALAQPLPVTAY